MADVDTPPKSKQSEGLCGLKVSGVLQVSSDQCRLGLLPRASIIWLGVGGHIMHIPIHGSVLVVISQPHAVLHCLCCYLYLYCLYCRGCHEPLGTPQPHKSGQDPPSPWQAAAGLAVAGSLGAAAAAALTAQSTVGGARCMPVRSWLLLAAPTCQALLEGSTAAPAPHMQPVPKELHVNCRLLLLLLLQ
jgi:hypothetical protein